ncbi:SURF1 family-domain-containing protein [Boeremia exigua]|uniref:SURF1 family-domain-containing protein n=1 Tax=Boeremia exigua TaxID=749465 RepID=UPI001E8D5EDC|nr:SURF1 family-domain-containing protein [Boeremia exigua]KAH6619936.1 SURF1 family-domain-containing protein [Boeremia exigua]
MPKPHPLLLLRRQFSTRPLSTPLRARPQCHPRTPFAHPRRAAHGPSPGLDPAFVSILDRPAKMARVGKQHGPGLIILALIPLTAFVLGCWQVQRLGWKTELIARFEDRLTFPPLELPLRIDEDVVGDFEYRRVWARGVLRHDLEMLVGPRTQDGEDGYTVVTPLERVDARGNATRVLCCRGWIRKDAVAAWFRRANGALPEGEVVVEGLLRVPPKANMFTPANEPEKGKWFFPSVEEMAAWSGSQRVWVEETMVPDLLTNYEREPKGIPIGRAPTVNLRNNHTQYIFTWYALSFATSIMFWMVVKKPLSGTQRRVRHSSEWS